MLSKFTWSTDDFLALMHIRKKTYKEKYLEEITHFITDDVLKRGTCKTHNFSTDCSKLKCNHSCRHGYGWSCRLYQASIKETMSKHLKRLQNKNIRCWKCK